MYYNSIYYEETLRCYNNLCHIAQKNNFESSLTKVYLAAKGTKKNFASVRAKCLREKKKFMEQIKERLEKSEYAFAIDNMLSEFDNWSNLCIKNLTLIYKENAEQALKGEINESHLN